MQDYKIKAIITGATGMVGEGILHECLIHPDIDNILVISRKTCGLKHPKVKELLVGDMNDLSSVKEHLSGYNACFFGLGVSSIGMKEEDYTKITYDLTMNIAKTLAVLNPEMTFCYVSGAATDSSEKGKSMWARVKGKTENDLMKLPFKKVFAFRPAFMKPTRGLKNSLKFYSYITWLYPVIRYLFPKYVTTLSELGLAMINCVKWGYDKSVLEVTDIVKLANTPGQ